MSFCTECQWNVLMDLGYIVQVKGLHRQKLELRIKTIRWGTGKAVLCHWHRTGALTTQEFPHVGDRNEAQKQDKGKDSISCNWPLSFKSNTESDSSTFLVLKIQIT